MDVLAILQERLKEEQWTRASVVDLSGMNELLQLLDSIIQQKKQDEASAICLDVLKTSPKSVIALVILGFCAYTLEDQENTVYLQYLIETLRDNKKNTIAELIAHKILENDPVNIYALQTLLQIHIENKNDSEKLAILLQLLRIDVKNGQIPQKIAEHYEQFPDKSAKDSDISLPVKYYQLSLRRYAKAQNTIKVEEIWKKLSHTPNNINYFVNIAMMVSEYNTELAATLLFNLVDILEEHKMYDEGISILKKLLILEPTNPKMRLKFLDLYRLKYVQAPQLELSIANSHIENPKEKLDSAIKKFEKEIQFEAQGYVYHQVWGVGIIDSIGDDFFIVDFEKHPKHRMSYNMALSSLLPLSKDHIWVIKKFQKNNDEMDMENILLTVLKSFPSKNLSIDDIKNELVPDVVTETKWTAWWNKAKTVLKSHSSIGTVKDGRPKYFIRTISIPFDEEMIEKFQMSRKFDEKLKIFEQFIKEVNILDDYTDQCKEMVSYFEGVLISSSRYDVQDRILSLLLIQRLLKTMPWAVEIKILPIAEIMENDKALADFLTSTSKVEYKRDITSLITQYHPNTNSILRDVLYSDNTQVADFIIEQLYTDLPPEDMKSLISQGITEIFRENPIMTFWFLNYALKSEVYKDLGMSIEDIYADVLYRLNTVGKLQEQKNLKWFKNSPNSTEVKKIISVANDILFKHTDFPAFITKHSSKKYISSIYELIKVSSALNSKYKTDLLKTLGDKIPKSHIDDTIITSGDIDYSSLEVIWTSNEGLDKQKKRLLDLEQERQDNLIELEQAREKGDLRENAEYQAAREKDTLLTNSITDLGEQLKKATVIDTDDISGEEVIPGTTVEIKKGTKKESYTILGFWDTDEENHIIAYNSPLAMAMLMLKKGDKTTIEIAGKPVSIEILSINPYKTK